MSRTLRSRTRSADTVKEQEAPLVEPARKLRKKQRHASDDDDDDESRIADELQSKGNVEDRPFEIIDCLPASIDPPDYNSALTHPLTVKDSAVLYNSLVQSRKTWVKGEMFELYWKRPKKDAQGAVVVDPAAQSGIRDRMQKMCEATMSAGPHQFDVRLFILKDDEVEKQWAEELEESRKLREEKKLEAQEQKKKRIEDKKQQQLQRKKEREQKAEAAKVARIQAKKEQELLKERMKEDKKKRKEEEKLLKKQQQRTVKPKGRPLSTGTNGIQGGEESARRFREDQTKQTAEARENHKMIMNLNHMSHEDAFLNQLMRKVARGSGSREEVNKFKEYIEIARNMAPCEEWIKHDKIEKERERLEKLKQQGMGPGNSDKKPETKGDVKASIPLVPIKNKNMGSAAARTNKPSNEGKLGSDTTAPSGSKNDTTSQGLKSEHNSLNIDAAKSDSTDADLTTSSINRSGSVAESSETSTPGPSGSEASTPGPMGNNPSVKTEKNPDGSIKQPKPRKRRLSKKDKLALNIVEEPKLTAFQQKYLTNAQLILEFAESTNARFRLPSDCVIEHDEAEDCYIISWILIHNLKDIAKFSRKKKLKTVEEALFWKECPPPLFSTMDIRLDDIPKRFCPILLNSVKPLAEVQERMARILEIGTRLSGYNLWYQLDGYDDAERAEDLRIDLNDYEHTLRGRRQRKNM